MDLLTILANEYNIPIIRKDQKVWFFRTKGGKYYYDFVSSGFIALGWDSIPSALICDTKQSKETKKAKIEEFYPDEKRPGLIFSQMDIFYNKMHNGDLVLIPDEGTKTISIGIIGDCVDDVLHQDENGDHEQCAYIHRRAVEWKNEIDSNQDVYLFRVLRAQQTISDVTAEATLLFRNLFPVYISGDSIHFTFQKRTIENLSLANNVDLLANLMKITDATARLYGKESFNRDLTMKTAVGSPGFLEIIMPNSPIAAISISVLLFMIRFFIGKEKTSEGGSATGLLAIITKVNELINDHTNRKKTDAEIRQIDANIKLTEAQTAKAQAEATLILSQTAKSNAEARRLELENEQIALLPSGQTTEQARIEGENLRIPNQDEISQCINNIDQYGCNVCKAAEANGLSFGGEKIGKAG